MSHCVCQCLLLLQLVIQAYDSLVPDQVAQETLVITIDNSAPVLNPNSATIEVSEFQPLGILYQVNATDADGDVLNYRFQNADNVISNFFWINPTDGSIMLQRSLTTVSTNRFVVRELGYV